MTGTRGGLTRRIVLAGAMVALLAVAAYALLFAVIGDLRGSARVTSRSEAILASATRLETLVTDLDAGLRGFVITGDERALRPWDAARAELPVEGATLERLTAGSGHGQQARARALVRDADAYVRNYSVPLMTTIRATPRSDRSTAAIEDGERRLETLRAEFGRFEDTQRGIAGSYQERSRTDARRAAIITAAGASAALLLIFFFAGYLAYAVLRPVRRTARTAGDIARGDLTGRIPETSRDEIGLLERVFNSMAASLKRSQDELQQVVEEQGALRRVATFIARGVSPIEIFSMVADELGRIRGADYTLINRFDPGEMATTVGLWTAPDVPDIAPPLNGHWPIEESTAAARILHTGRPARATHDRAATSKIGIWSRRHGVHHVVGCPITVEGRLWGMAAVLSLAPEPLPDDTEERVAEFMELLATAIANAASSSELLASHTRVVAASDETRDGIERNLNDMARQRLITLRHDLLTTISALPPEQEELRGQLTRTAQGLAGVLDDLREITQGLRPAALSRSGLRPALKILAQRSRVPVELTVRAGPRLNDNIELAVYYTVSEALTNVAKYAHASLVRIELAIENGSLRLSVRDDGVGGADAAHGSGLIGLKDRIEALGGKLRFTSPAGSGTSLLIVIPIEGEQPPHAATSPFGVHA